MLNLDTPVQIGAFAAAGEVFATIARLDPTNARALAAAGTVVAVLAPTYEELAQHHAAAGLPPIPEADYTAMLASARGFALTVATSGETQH